MQTVTYSMDWAPLGMQVFICLLVSLWAAVMSWVGACVANWQAEERNEWRDDTDRMRYEHLRDEQERAYALLSELRDEVAALRKEKS